MRIAIKSADLNEVTEKVATGLEVSFESRDSSFWGGYRLCDSEPSIQIIKNLDPMFIEGTDPPEEKYFEYEFRGYGILINIGDSGGEPERIAELILKVFDGEAAIIPKRY